MIKPHVHKWVRPGTPDNAPPSRVPQQCTGCTMKRGLNAHGHLRYYLLGSETNFALVAQDLAAGQVALARVPVEGSPEEEKDCWTYEEEKDYWAWRSLVLATEHETGIDQALLAAMLDQVTLREPDMDIVTAEPWPTVYTGKRDPRAELDRRRAELVAAGVLRAPINWWKVCDWAFLTAVVFAVGFICWVLS